jgi:tryptophan-rich sensory protein
MSVWTVLMIIIISSAVIAFHETYLRGRPNPPWTIFICVVLAAIVWWLA